MNAPETTGYYLNPALLHRLIAKDRVNNDLEAHPNRQSLNRKLKK